MRTLLVALMVCGVATAAFGAWGDTSGRILNDRDWSSKLGDGAYINSGYAQSARVWKENGQECNLIDWVGGAGKQTILDWLAANPLPDPNAGRVLFQLDLTGQGGWAAPYNPNYDLQTLGLSGCTVRTLNMAVDWQEGDGCDGAGCTGSQPGGTGSYNWTAAWNDFDGASTCEFAQTKWAYDQWGLKYLFASVQWQNYDGSATYGSFQNSPGLFTNTNNHYCFIQSDDPSFVDGGNHYYMDLDFDPAITSVTPGTPAPIVNDLLYNSSNRGLCNYDVRNWDDVTSSWVTRSGANATAIQLEKFNTGQQPAIIITLAHYGDVNLDGLSDQTDLGLFAQNYEVLGPGVADGRNWDQGDFSGDGIVDQTDLGLLAQYYEVYGFGGGAVPEPASLVLLASGAACLLGRRRRSRR